MSCEASLVNKEENSMLYPALEKIDGAKAKDWFDYMKSDIFKERFGNYILGHNLEINPFEGRVYETGEPKLEYNKALKKHYFIDKEGEKFYYPFDRVGLDGLFTTNEKLDLGSSIALAFSKKEGLNLDIDSLISDESNDESLMEFINHFLEKLSEDMMDDMENIGLAIAVEESLKHTSEWESVIKGWFKQNNIILSEKEVEAYDDFQAQEYESRGEIVRRASFLKSAKGNMLSNIKMFLSLVEGVKLNEFGRYTYVPFNDIYVTLNSLLANTVAVVDSTGELEDSYDIYLEKIKGLERVKPWAKVLIAKLEANKDNEEFKNQFVSAFNLHRNLFLGSEFEKGAGGKITFTVKNLSDVGSRQTNVLTQWYENFNRLEQEDKIQSKIKELQTIIQAYNSTRNRITDEEVFAMSVAKLRTGLSEIGILTSPEGFDYFLNGNSVEEKTLEERKSIFGKFANRLYSNILKDYLENVASKAEVDSNIFKTQQTVVALAKAESFFKENSTDSSIYTMGKSKWTYSNPSYLDVKLAIWKKNPQILYDHYLADKYNKHSVLMKYLLGLDANGNGFNMEKAKEKLADIEIGIFNSIQEKGDSINASDNNDISYTDAFVDYIHKALGQKGNGKKSWSKTALAADKATEYQVNYGMGMIDAEAKLIKNDRGEWVIDMHSRAKNILLGYFLDEYSRMNQVAAEIKTGKNLVPNKHLGPKNGLKSQMFPSLSFPLSREVKEDLGFDLYTVDGNPAFTELSDNKKRKVREYITKIAEKRIKATYDKLVSESVIGYNHLGELVNNSIDTALFNSYKSAKMTVAKAAFQLAGDLFINSIVSQAEYAKMFTGDLAYYKSMTDYRKRVPATYTDGLYLNISDKEQEFTIAVIETVLIDEPTLEYMKEYTSPSVWKQFQDSRTDEEKELGIAKHKDKRVDTTDAQAWITPKRWEFIMRKLGKWTKTHESVSKKMGEKIATYTASERKVLAQPLKGVYFDVKDGRPTFLKYSQAVLVPNLVRNNPGLKKISDKMYSQNIDEVITKGGIKVGAPIATKTHDALGNVLDDFKLEPMKLNNAFWKLQQDLPTKGIKLNDVGTQIQKNIYQGLAHHLELDFQLDGKEISGSDMIDHLNEVSSTMLEQNLQVVLSELGVNPETLEIENEDILYESILTQLEKRRDVPANMINALKAGNSPFGIPGGNEIFQNIFSSIINNRVNKLKTNGGGFIQMADYGITKAEAENNKGIKYTPWFLDSSDTRAHVPKVEIDPLTGKETLTPAGLFVPASLISQYIPDYTKYSTEELFGKLDKRTGKYVGGMIDQDILENIIGYRIPNQGLASNDSFRILGILPESMGDSIIAYAGITTKTGSDFDIDKMYLMTPAVKFNEITNKLEYVRPKTKTVDGITTELPLSLQSNEVLQNKLIEAYKAVLTQGSAEIMDKVMNPIDVPFMEMDIQNLNIQKDPEDFDNFNAILDLEMKIKFKTSKAGLGVAVNNTMDFIQGAMGHLQLKNKVEFGNLKGPSKLDNEYSEELSNAEMKSYIEDYNKRVPEEEEISLKDISKYQRISLADSLMALTNGFVDVANKPFIIDGNWVNQTNNLGFMLLRAGVHPFRLNAFLNQPIIKDYVAHKNNIESKTVESSKNPVMSFKLATIANKLDGEKIYFANGKQNTAKKVFYTTIADLKKIEYKSINAVSEFENATDAQSRQYFITERNKYYSILKIRIAQAFDLNPEELKDHVEAQKVYDLINDTVRESFAVTPVPMQEISFKRLRKQNVPAETEEAVQETMLEFYLAWTQMAKPLSQNVTASKHDVNGKGKNIVTTMLARNNFAKARSSKELIGFNTKLSRNDKRTPLQTSMDVSVNIPWNIMVANPKFFATASPLIERTFNKISELIYGEDQKYLTNPKLGDKLTFAYNSYMLSAFKPFRLSKDEKRTLVDNIVERYKKVLIAHPENILLKELISIEGDAKQYFLGMSNAGRVPQDKNNITDSWRDLLEDPTTEGFAEDLIKYAFLMSGGNKTSSQFYEFIPYEWFNKNGFNTFLKAFSSYKTTEDVDQIFINQFFRHNMHDNAIAKKESEDLYKPYTLSGLGTNSFLSAKHPTPENKIAPHIITIMEERGMPGQEQEFKINYILVGQGSVSRIPIYARVTPLGLRDGRGNRIPEYSAADNNGITQRHLSVFKDNAFTGSEDIMKDIINFLTNPNDIIAKKQTEFNQITDEDVVVVDKSNKPRPTKKQPTQASEVSPFKTSKVQQKVYHVDKRKGLNEETLVDDYSMVNVSGVFFTTEKEYAEKYAKDTEGIIYEAYIDVQIPLITGDKQEIENLGRIPTNLPKKYDSVIHNSDDIDADKYGKVGTEIVVYNSKQIKITNVQEINQNKPDERVLGVIEPIYFEKEIYKGDHSVTYGFTKKDGKYYMLVPGEQFEDGNSRNKEITQERYLDALNNTNPSTQNPLGNINEKEVDENLDMSEKSGILAEDNKLKESDISIASKLEEVTYTHFKSGELIKIKAYKVTFANHPNVKVVTTNLDLDYQPEPNTDGKTFGYINKRSSWVALDLTTGRNMSVASRRKDIPEQIVHRINTVIANKGNTSNKEILGNIGFDFNEPC